MTFPVFGAAVLAALWAALPHPHVPKAIVLGGAKGKVTVTYFTVPYDAKELEALKPGFQWHLGFAVLESEVALNFGDVGVVPGKYKLDARRGADPGAWDLVLTDFALVSAKRKLEAADTAGKEAAAAAVHAREQEIEKAGGKPELVLKAHDYAADDDAHLSMAAISTGYTTVKPFSTDPKGGIEFSLRIGFGKLHREVAGAEAFE